MYKPVSNKIDFAAMEKDILTLWAKEDTFQKSMTERKSASEFVFYDGPPFATGLPHYGHLLAGTIKDIVPRYQTMRGHYVDRRFGWDCHGLPVEYEVEQDLEISGKTEIEKMGVDKFNEACRSIVLRYTREWREIVTRMGRWVDFDRDYKTMEPTYMESIWWVFKALWEKGLIYEGSKILPYCPRCSTPLSNFETNQGYRDVADPAITIRFKLDNEPNAYILAWTTTPWTLPSNMALAVGKDITYVRVKEKDAVYYLAKARFAEYYKKPEQYESVTELKGSELLRLTYEPLFPYFADKKAEGAFRVVNADFVSTEDGTGVVHIAPGFGEDDYRLGLAEQIPVVCPVDEEGRFTAVIKDYAGQDVKKADHPILARLKEEKKLVHRSQILHSYPHCWRCDTPLIYRAISTWFVKVEQIKDRLIEANKKVHWVPEHLRDGRFGKWLEGARDWAISRNRYWGTPLPIWRSKDGDEMVCVGSIEELEQLSGQKISDLHKHNVDKLEIPSRNGKGTLKRIPEVLDCWFESGAMPYAQAHYPFENKEHFESHFPADFIAEGLDQTRGWFYTLMVLSVALFDKPAFKNVIVNGLVLAKDGKKMSKRLKNYPDPVHVINSYGADALRLYMVNSPVVRTEDLCFSEDGVKHVLRDVLIPLWNAYSFFVTYANIDGWHGDGTSGCSSNNVLDRWIRSSLESLAVKVTTAMDNYDLQNAARPFVGFIDDLTNWYIRRSRRRFWKSQDDDDKEQAYRTLSYVLIQLSRIAAPFIPFMSESIYQNLRSKGMPESVHLCGFPVPDGSNRDEELEEQMAEVMTVVKLGRLLRAEKDLKIRQPLASMHVVSRNPEILRRIETRMDIIIDELNVRKLEFGVHETELADLKAKPDFKRMGPRLGPLVKAAAGVIAKMDGKTIENILSGAKISLSVNGQNVEVDSNDIIVERIPRKGLVVASEGPVIVALETELSSDLIQEGLAREFVNKIQNMRKTADFEVTQRIKINFTSDAEIKEAVMKFIDYLKTETLCLDLNFVQSKPAGANDWDINGHSCAIEVIPVKK
ncbi:MAG: isoleucine--tRNA ligase [Kiritimatiellae bacterium]|nr:isoleucine--tRNA ligase [Kiritimatiellia bacterium]MDD5521229.1 isoleucine--tRNA ligase [Kiritimatiellia bacterium]